MLTLWSRRGLGVNAERYSLFSHTCVFENVNVDEESLLMFPHTTQEKSPLLQQTLENQREEEEQHLSCSFMHLDFLLYVSDLYTHHQMGNHWWVALAHSCWTPPGTTEACSCTLPALPPPFLKIQLEHLDTVNTAHLAFNSSRQSLPFRHVYGYCVSQFVCYPLFCYFFL